MKRLRHKVSFQMPGLIKKITHLWSSAREKLCSLFKIFIFGCEVVVMFQIGKLVYVKYCTLQISFRTSMNERYSTIYVVRIS